MRISHKYGFVFLAFPRAASTTVRDILEPYSDVRAVHISNTTEEFPYYNHMPARELKDIFEKKGWNWDDYTRFCVVRNPFDRVVSLYHHHLTFHEVPGQPALTKFKRKIKQLIRSKTTFDQFVDVLDPTRGLTRSLHYFITSESGDLLVPNVIMFENLHSELADLLNHTISIKDDVVIPHLNASKRREEYRSYYDTGLVERISKIYRYEIERFGYVF